MSSWLPSWFSFPKFDVSIFPNLQRKFFSFILKRFLGHLVKPGQLDVEQIDSAIGSGNLTINDLKLECTSINALLSGLPIQLHEGCIASVSARMPWPNPLTNGVELSVRSLNLIFHLHPRVAKDVPLSPTNLADSISDAAQLFAHEEITREESTEVYQAFQSSRTPRSNKGDDYVPGGLDASREDHEVHPDVDPTGISMFASMFEYLLSQFTFSAKDISITVVHLGHSSFRFKVSEFQYGKPTAGRGESTRTITISGVEMAHRDLGTLGSPVCSHSESGSLSSRREFNAASYEVDNMVLSSTAASPSLPTSKDRSGSKDPVPSVDSWVPEHRSRPSSPSGSTTSSLFQSALTTQGSGREFRSFDATVAHSHDVVGGDTKPDPSSRIAGDRPPSPADEATKDELFHRVIISLVTEPIVIHITTSTPPVPPIPLAQTAPTSHTTEPDTSRPDTLQPNLEISVLVGVVACALTATQIGAILDIVSVIGSHSGQNGQPSVSKNPGLVAPPLSFLDQASLMLQIRGIVLLLQSVPASLTASFEDAHDVPLNDFFSHPLTPPKPNYGYIRFIVDTIKADFSVSTTLEQLVDEPSPILDQLRERRRASRGVRGTTSSQLRFSIGDLSACAFCVPNNAMAAPAAHDSFALPILLTDPLLFTQYSPDHHPPPTVEQHQDISPEFIREAFSPLPEFEILDWTSEEHRTSQAKLSLWRVNPPPGYRRSHRSHPGNSPPLMASGPNVAAEESSTNRPQSALSGQVLLSSSRDPGIGTDAESACDIHVNIIPLHVFVDVGSMGAALDFLEVVSSRRTSPGSPTMSSGSSNTDSETEDHEGAHRYTNSDDLTPLSSPQGKTLQQIRQQELDDLNLSVDYLSEVSAPGRPSPRLRKSHGRTQGLSRRDSLTEFDINFVMVRIQLRCPSPLSLPQRSGATILDVHGLTLTSRLPLGAKEMYAHTEGMKAESTCRNSSSRDNHLLTAEWRALLIAGSSAGETTARGFCSVGPLPSPAEREVPSSKEHIRFMGDTPPIRRFAFIKLAQNPPFSSGRKSKRSGVFVAEIDVPSMCLNFSKPLFDDLQFWVDDVSQLLERTLGPSSDAARENSSRNPSLVGSRFFSSSKQGSVNTTVDNAPPGHSKSFTENIVKVTISEASMRLLIPYQIEGAADAVEPFDIFVSDVDVLLESKPEGKDETVITLSIMGITVLDAANPFPYPVLSLAAPRSLFSTPKPIVKLRFSSIALHETASKESRVKLTFMGFMFNVFPDVKRIDSLVSFARPPPGVFESVVPNERTQIAVKIGEGSMRLFAPNNAGAFVLHIGDLDLSTEMVGDSPEISFCIAGRDLAALFTDNYLEATQDPSIQTQPDAPGALHWKRLGYALLSEVSDLALRVRRSNNVLVQSEVVIDHINIRIHLCADTGSALGLYFGHFGSAFGAARGPPNITSSTQPRHPTVVSGQERSSEGLTYSIDQHAFQSIPEVGAAPDMIHDDLPSNPDYLDVSFGAAAGLRELNDDDLDMDASQGEPAGGTNLPAYSASVISNVGGETIKLLDPKGVQVVENFFNTLPVLVEASPQLAEDLDRVVVREGNVTLFLYEGYDWATTRKVIEDELKKMKQRLARIKQLVASGQTYDSSIDPTNALLFNSIHVGLDQDVDEMEPGALIAAIDEQLREDNDTASVSSWQSLRPASSGRPNVQHPRLRGRRLTRSRGPSIEIRLSGLFAEAVKFVPNDEIVSRAFTTIKDVEILDHVKTSTWKKFLTALRSDSRGNIRETGSDMVRIELRSVHPVPGNSSEETRLRVKILPLRLHVDQDALDFLKKFFNFQNPNTPLDPEPRSETYLQRAEVYPVMLKLDYKPRRVDYRALREGRTIELMNFFHFDGAEMTLRHLTLFGVAGWPRFFDMLNDLWTPDVKATQLADVISGVSPIRSVVNVGSGVADLVLLPIAQYRKDGRVVRGLQKGTKAFVRSTAMEAVKLGAQLATGTQVILEQAENVLGSGFGDTILAETVSHPPEDTTDTVVHGWTLDEESTDPISRYAEQPVDIREGIQSAYTSIRRNLSSAAQTILAVPMEVFERSGSEGPVRAVIRAVPIAVLRPMIGASEAVSKTLLGLHNTMDPEIRHENAAKYKHR